MIYKPHLHPVFSVTDPGQCSGVLDGESMLRAGPQEEDWNKSSLVFCEAGVIDFITFQKSVPSQMALQESNASKKH
jgi:hypothetical protein